MNAYDSSYVAGAQQSLGSMFDFAVHYLRIDLQVFYSAFLANSISIRFAAGDPAIVAGRSGQELALEVAGIQKPERLPGADGAPYLATEEYWTGWALAYYQWASGDMFSSINQRVPIQDVRALYTPYHEMDVRQFCDRMNELSLAAQPSTNLQMRRLDAGLSQSQLARAAGVPVRTLQQYEQRQKDINHARADYVLSLARTLACSPADILEYLASSSFEYAVVSLE